MATKALRLAAKNIGARLISLSGCHQPGDAYFTPGEVEEMIRSADGELIVVMADDEGFVGEGRGEKIIRHLSNSSDVEILGVVAVASHTEKAKRIKVDSSVDRFGQVHQNAVDKEGNMIDGDVIQGDTVEVLRNLPVKTVIGLGDPGKMFEADEVKNNAPITTKALQEVLKKSGIKSG
jgi:stage V sporulation protein AE